MDKKMHPGIKQEWVTALRSGKYEQGHWKLRLENDTFCCLGVLCDILPDEIVKWKPTPVDGRYVAIDSHGEDQAATLSWPLMKEMGLEYNTAGQLMALNDGLGGQRRSTFPEIADWIETNL
jgi:hypothetical protein